MNRYEYLTDTLNQKLGNNYDVKYYQNESVTWEDLYQDNKYHGVCSVTGGNTTVMGGVFVEVETIQLSILIPVDIDIYGPEVQHIDAKIRELNGVVNEWGSEYVEVALQQRVDQQIYLLNGEEYGLVSVYLNLTCYDNAVLGNEAYIKVKVNGTYEQLSGVTNIVYKCEHQQDSVVLGVQNPVAKNHLAAITKTITADIILCRDDAIHTDFMTNDGTNKKYEIKYYNGFITRSLDVSILALTEYAPMGNTIKGQLVLGLKY